jgi:hypothetical protein
VGNIKIQTGISNIGTLTYVSFSMYRGDYPLFKSVVQIMTTFKLYLQNVRDNFLKLIKDLVLWVILKQSFQFSISKMDILGEFKMMYKYLNDILCANHQDKQGS